MLGHHPGKQKVTFFSRSRLGRGHHLPSLFRAPSVGRLQEVASGDAPHLPVTPGGPRPPLCTIVWGEQAEVLFCAQDSPRCPGETGRDHNLEKYLAEGLCCYFVHLAVEGDDTPKDRGAIPRFGL